MHARLNDLHASLRPHLSLSGRTNNTKLFAGAGWLLVQGRDHWYGCRSSWMGVGSHAWQAQRLEIQYLSAEASPSRALSPDDTQRAAGMQTCLKDITDVEVRDWGFGSACLYLFCLILVSVSL